MIGLSLTSFQWSWVEVCRVLGDVCIGEGHHWPVRMLSVPPCFRQRACTLLNGMEISLAHDCFSM